jgi:hypothetical protein
MVDQPLSYITLNFKVVQQAFWVTIAAMIFKNGSSSTFIFLSKK